MNKYKFVDFHSARPGHDLRYALNSNKIKKKIKWKHKININDGLIKRFNWYLDNKNFS